jgi:hypothetical protein
MQNKQIIMIQSNAADSSLFLADKRNFVLQKEENRSEICESGFQNFLGCFNTVD